MGRQPIPKRVKDAKAAGASIPVESQKQKDTITPVPVRSAYAARLIGMPGAKRNNKKPNVLIIDSKEGWYLDYIDNPEGNLYGYKDLSVALMISHEGVLKPYVRLQDIDTLPEKLYRALHWMECKILFTVKMSTLEKLQAGATIALVAILLFFIYLIMSSAHII
jgi:hypothetical protein